MLEARHGWAELLMPLLESHCVWNRGGKAHLQREHDLLASAAVASIGGRLSRSAMDLRVKLFRSTDVTLYHTFYIAYRPANSYFIHTLINVLETPV